MTGQYSEGASPATTFPKGIAILATFPVVGFCGLMMFLGLRTMMGPNPLHDDLSVCFWAGLVVLVAWLLLLFHVFWRVPRRTITSFELTDDSFICATPRDGERTYPLSTFRSVQILAGKRRIYGWYVRFNDGAMQINADMPNAEQLVAGLHSRR